MKPASFQSMASSVMSPNMTLGHLLSTSNVMRCEKCQFATTDIAAFKKHVANEHTEYYCFYCNSVSFSEAELQTHLKLHTSTGPFKCPHCGQIYMRRMCLVKHIERLHSKIITQGPPKFDTTKVPHISVSSASQSLTDPTSLRPVVRVTVPTPTTTAVRLVNTEQRQKALDSRPSNASNGDAVPSNGQVHYNRALTVSLPEEVSIPAGCMVEVAEVKTVNGTKELRLRFVAHQENESVIKNARSTVSNNTEPTKLLSSTPHYQNILKSPGSAINMANKKASETKIVNVECPTLGSGNVSKSFQNQIPKEKCRNGKRMSPEVINLDSDVPNKVSRGVISSVGEAKGVTQKEPINLNRAPAVIASRFANRLTRGLQPENLSTHVRQRGIEERKSCIQEHPSSSASRLMNSVQSTPHIVPMKLGPVNVRPKENPSLQMKQEMASLQQQSLKPLSPSLKHTLAAPAQIRPTNECKDNFTSKAFFPVQGSAHKTSPEPLPVKILNIPPRTDMTLSALPQEVKTEKRADEGVRAEREGFPVISSVYSLSQQPHVAQESTQPIVMAEWTNSAGRETIKIKSVCAEQPNMASAYHDQTDLKDGSFTHDLISKKSTCESVKVKQHQGIQQTPTMNGGTFRLIPIRGSPQQISSPIKQEESTPAKESKNCSDASTHKTCPPHQETILIPNTNTSTAAENIQQKPVTVTNEMDKASKFLTVSLKRVQVGVWKKSKKRVKPILARLRIPVPIGSPRDCTVLQLMPLRTEQLVKQPGPDQPVVVLNHPTPCVPIQSATSDSFRNTGACVTPKCQILKMKLSKVMGQKYEVMGCTVRNFS